MGIKHPPCEAPATSERVVHIDSPEVRAKYEAMLQEAHDDYDRRLSEIQNESLKLELSVKDKDQKIDSLERELAKFKLDDLVPKMIVRHAAPPARDPELVKEVERLHGLLADSRRETHRAHDQLAEMHEIQQDLLSQMSALRTGSQAEIPECKKREIPWDIVAAAATISGAISGLLGYIIG